MAKFSRKAPAPAMTGPVTTTEQRTLTGEGGAGWVRDVKSELFLLAVTNLVSEPTFYETAGARDARFATLVKQATAEDPDWTARLIRWLRAEANMRSASIVAAATYVHAGGKDGRAVVSSALQRPDEPAEMLAYWRSTYAHNGKVLASAVQRGVADAAIRLFNENAALKYDGTASAWRMADVIELTHPEPKADWQSTLFRYLLDRRHHPDEIRTDVEILHRIAAWRALQETPVEDRRDALAWDILAQAGMTWESLSGWLNGPMDKAAWEAIIPSMGYMALLRNLRNFDEAGVSDEVAAKVAARLADPENVAHSRQFPLRFLSAFKAAPSLRWAWALEQAVQASLANVPVLPGRTLILVDGSWSMSGPLSAKSALERWEAAALFGSALALRAEHANLYVYSSAGGNDWMRANGTNRWTQIPIVAGGSVLPMIEQIHTAPGFGGGTETWQTLADTYAGHDRVIILTDEQAHPGPLPHAATAAGPTRLAPGYTVPLITFNLAGYRAAHIESGPNRVTIGGLTDQGFTMLNWLDKRARGEWPF